MERVLYHGIVPREEVLALPLPAGGEAAPVKVAVGARAAAEAVAQDGRTKAVLLLGHGAVHRQLQTLGHGERPTLRVQDGETPPLQRLPAGEVIPLQGMLAGEVRHSKRMAGMYRTFGCVV